MTPPNTREGIKDWIETCLDADAHGKWLRAPNFDIIQDVAELMAPRFHQELQKARVENYALAVKHLKEAYESNGATTVPEAIEWLEDNVRLYQSELDQLTPIEIPVQGTQIDCKEHGVNQIVIKDGAGWCPKCLNQSELDQSTN